jgi:protein-disulfide isomerase
LRHLQAQERLSILKGHDQMKTMRLAACCTAALISGAMLAGCERGTAASDGASVVDAAAASPDATGNFDQGERDEIGTIVRDYLMAHPEVIFEAAEVYQNRQAQEQKDQARAQLGDMADFLYNDPTSPLGGNPEGDVTVVEFFDYNCPYCKRSHAAVEELLESDPDIRYVFKQFPILGPTSVTAAKAALAADMQGKYLEVHNAFMNHQGRFESDDQIFELIASLDADIDMDKLRADVNSAEVQKIIDDNHEAAQRLNITGTPGYIFGDEIVGGVIEYDEMVRKVAAIRAEKAEDSAAPAEETEIEDTVPEAAPEAVDGTTEGEGEGDEDGDGDE